MIEAGDHWFGIVNVRGHLDAVHSTRTFAEADIAGRGDGAACCLVHVHIEVLGRYQAPVPPKPVRHGKTK